jgi:hypothetical protein
VRTILLVATAALAGGCGGGNPPDYAPNFAGIWTGALTVTDTSTQQVLSTGTAQAYFIYLGPNTLRFDNACSPNNGPLVVATSATEFSGNLVSHCNSVSFPGCASVVLTWTSLSGSLNGPVLAFTALSTLVGCGVNDNLSFVFTNGVGGGTPSQTPSR